MHRWLIGLIVWALVDGTFGGLAAETVQYGPAVVQLAGFLSREKHFGPPGYGEDPKTDSVEEALILVLDGAVNVQGDPTDSLNSESVNFIHRIQLVIQDKENRKLWRMQGEHVVIEGTLFHSFSGHHHTRVLMEVKSFRHDPVPMRPNPALGP